MLWAHHYSIMTTFLLSTGFFLGASAVRFLKKADDLFAVKQEKVCCCRLPTRGYDDNGPNGH